MEDSMNSVASVSVSRVGKKEIKNPFHLNGFATGIKACDYYGQPIAMNFQ